MPIRRFTALGAVALALFAGLVPGCAEKSNRLPVYPAKGQVLVGGKPAKGVFVRLWPAAPPGPGTDAVCPNGQTDDAGNFVITTYDTGDGAPAGEYKVTADWPARFNTLSNRWEGDKLKGRYADSKTSQLTVTIQKGPNEIAVINLTE